MGLDMYLKKKIYVGAEYDFRKVQAKIEITANGKPMSIDASKVSEIVESAGYWRKANAIHNWFVQNVQDGKDECQESHVSWDQLMELKGLCMKVLATKDASLLPPSAGFFFGSTDVDEYYFEDLESTVVILSALSRESDSDYFYRASW